MQTLGIDLGGTNVRAGLVNRRGRVLARASIRSIPRRGVRTVVDAIAQLCREVAGKRWKTVRACGIGAPGPLDKNRTKIEFAPNLGWKNVPLARLLREKLRRKVVLENDANCAAYGESVSGAGAGSDSMVMYTLGTGVGGGIVLDGKLWLGANGGAGELGHVIVLPRGRRCNCGRLGCLEAYASATAIKNRYRSLTGIEETVKNIFKSAGRKARTVVEEATSALATGIVNVVHTLHPERIVIGGGVARAGAPLMNPLRKEVKARVFPGYARTLKIVPAKLGDDAGIVGAALLAVR